MSQRSDSALAQLSGPAVFARGQTYASLTYTELLALVKKILQRMAPAQQAPWLATLRVQCKSKRNVLADLP